MTNFYKELNLDSSKGTEDLKAELSKLENIWKQREIFNPEKSATVIALIAQARLVFATDASRRAYDQELAESQRNPEITDTEKERKEALDRWTEQARLYSANGQYDLAKVAIDNALSFSNNINDNELYKMAAAIYYQNNSLDIAMTYINKAIVAAPNANVSGYYLLKGFIYDGQAVAGERGSQIYNIPHCRSEERKMYMIAVSMAERNNDAADLARAYGALAYSFYFHATIDKLKAKEYADLALNYGGDSLGHADKVFNAINEDIYNEAQSLSITNDITKLKKAIELLNTIAYRKDAVELIHNCKEKINKIRRKEEAERIKREKKAEQDRIIAEKKAEQDKKNKKILEIGSLVFLSVALLITAVVIVLSNIESRKAQKEAYEAGIEHYNTAISYLEENNLQAAALEFGKAGDYEDAQERSLALWKAILKPSVISIGTFTGNNYIVGLKTDGTVVATGRNDKGQCDVSDWSNIVSVSAGFHHTVGLKSDGTVVSVGSNNCGERNVGTWKNIVQVVAGDQCTIGLQSDGTLLFTGTNSNGEDECTNWNNIIEVWVAGNYPIGKTLDGKIVSPYKKYDHSSSDAWKNLKKVSYCYEYGICGLKQDNTVIFDKVTTYQYPFSDSFNDVKYWTDIVDMDSGAFNVIGIKADGTVVAAGSNSSGQNDVSDWSDIVIISTQGYQTIGVKSDGTVLLVGDICWGIDVSQWHDIMIP